MAEDPAISNRGKDIRKERRPQGKEFGGLYMSMGEGT